MNTRVDLKDARCRTCGSQLVITDGDDETLTVRCIECDDTYEIEPHALPGCIEYYVPFMARKLTEENDA